MRFKIITKGENNYRVWDAMKRRTSRQKYSTPELARLAKQNKMLEEKWKKLFKKEQKNWTTVEFKRAQLILDRIAVKNLQLEKSE